MTLVALAEYVVFPPAAPLHHPVVRAPVSTKRSLDEPAKFGLGYRPGLIHARSPTFLQFKLTFCRRSSQKLTRRPIHSARSIGS
jgi:hypothetical protein